ncbi:CobW family GTP-binding protein [uncultured Ilumatobacter sp.]|uniref:CobW family GTP-binding protein n=1 Tax=uncultured Ilumatobacter sp. TaxID=879968 RepID=UPI00374E77AB
MPYQEPEFLPWDGRRVPITFVAGYLGAGKTTAINELLAVTDRPIAVFVNDVGEINIDAALIARRHGDTVELTDGCVCCSLVDGFGAAFDQLRARDTPPDHVIVELSGVADPDRMTPWGNSAGFMLDGVVVVVAADQLLLNDQATTVTEAIKSQVAKADLVVLTKTDLIDDAQRSIVDARLADLGGDTPVFVAGASDPAIGRFLALGGRRPDGVAATATPSLFDAHTVTTVEFGPFESAQAIDDALRQMLDDTIGTVMRAKGIVATHDEQLHLVQVVGRRREVTALPMSEFAAPTPLTVIALN